MAWPKNPRPAKSLLVLVDEVNRIDPDRPKGSDGMLGDTDHQNRTSDHNPWVRDGSVGVVTAADITEDVTFNGQQLNNYIAKTIIDRRDPRVKYLIHEGKICRSYPKGGLAAWQWGPYDGPNGHFHHLHVSVLPEKAKYDNTMTWGLVQKEMTDMEWIYKARREILATTAECLPHISQKRAFSRRVLWSIRRLALTLPKPK